MASPIAAATRWYRRKGLAAGVIVIFVFNPLDSAILSGVASEG